MVTVNFYGDLKQFGSTFELDVLSVPEALRALLTQIPGLRAHMEKGNYKVKSDERFLTAEDLNSPVNNTLNITPVIAGAGKNMGVGQIIMGVIMIAVSYIPGVNAVAAAAFFSMGAGLIAGGVAQLLTKIPKMDEGNRDSDNAKSSSFSNLANMSAQGAPVPVIYGEMLVGSKVLSQGVRSVYTGTAGSGSTPGNPSNQPQKVQVKATEKRLSMSPVPEGSPDYPFDSGNWKVINKNHTAIYEKVED